MFSAKACEKLGYYVYLYIDPRTNRPFYIGKGTGNRCFAHLKDARDSQKVKVIRALTKLRMKPKIDPLKYGLTESEALLVEATAIDLLNIESLANVVRGFGSRIGSRASVEAIAATLNAKPVKITEAAILINIHRNFSANMEPQAIYDATRSAWRVGPNRENAKWAFSIYAGVVREIYEIQAWLPGGTTMKLNDLEGRPRKREGRFEFVGQVAEDRVRRKYLGRSVLHYQKPGAQNPVMYLNCD